MSAAFGFRSAGTTHAGTVRQLNEDAFLDRPELGLWAVADGVGGASAGDYASRLIVERLGELAAPRGAAAMLAAVADRLAIANETLQAVGLNEGGITIASTVAVLIAHGEHFACAWAGDSRVYRLRDRLEQLTRDHSLVQEMVDAGQLAPEAARDHPQANAITRAVGADETVDIEVIQGQLAAGDIFLLCSDGLTKIFGDGEIAELLALMPVEAAPARFVELGLARGAPDNVTVVVVEVEGATSVAGGG